MVDGSHFPSFGFPCPLPSEDTILTTNPYLYRVYLAKENQGLRCHGFMARRYETTTPHTCTDAYYVEDLIPDTPSDSDIDFHIRNWKHVGSPFISTSVSFVWAVVEACRRIYVASEYKADHKDLHVAFISSAAIAKKCKIVSPLHRDCLDIDGLSEKFANSSSEILVIGQIPADAIEFSISVDALLKVLPDFWKQDRCHRESMPIFDQAWFALIRSSKSSITRSADNELRIAFKRLYLNDIDARINVGVRLAVDIIDNSDWANDQSRSLENVSS